MTDAKIKRLTEIVTQLNARISRKDEIIAKTKQRLEGSRRLNTKLKQKVLYLQSKVVAYTGTQPAHHPITALQKIERPGFESTR
jgi:uncharacterized protein (DUF3084 family)